MLKKEKEGYINFCKKYLRYRDRSILLYSKKIKLNEEEYLKIYIRRAKIPHVKNAFSIEAVLENRGKRSLEEILLIYQRESDFNELYQNKIIKTLCKDEKTVKLENSQFFSILDLGSYRRKSIFKNLYSILTNYDLKYEKIEFFLSDIFKNNWRRYMKSIKVYI